MAFPCGFSTSTSKVLEHAKPLYSESGHLSIEPIAVNSSNGSLKSKAGISPSSATWEPFNWRGQGSNSGSAAHRASWAVVWLYYRSRAVMDDDCNKGSIGCHSLLSMAVCSEDLMFICLFPAFFSSQDVKGKTSSKSEEILFQSFLEPNSCKSWTARCSLMVIYFINLPNTVTVTTGIV